MSGIVHQKCLNHAQREAAVRCPACKRFFCRECVSENEGRYLCVQCLQETISGDTRKKRRLVLLQSAIRLAAAVLFLWFSFSVLGKMIVSIPNAYHETLTDIQEGLE